MKKRILSAVLVSGVTLGAATVVSADTFDSQISEANKNISNLTSQQQAARNKVVSLLTQVSALQSEQEKLSAQNADLQERSKQYEQEIQTLTNDIIARNDKLAEQARSAQRGSQTSTYINTLLNSKSISDAVTRFFAINRAVSANAKLLEHQKADKAALLEKQEANQAAINTVSENQQALKDNEAALTTQKAQLEAAQLELSAQLATAEDKKAELISKKEAAEEAARKAAAEQAAAKAKAEEQAKAQAASVAKAQAELAQQAQATAPAAQTSQPTAAPSSLVAPAAQTAATTATATPTAVPQPRARRSTPTATPASYTPSISNANNTYPMGQCTWGAKALAPWAGNAWGNGGQWATSARAAGFTVSSTPIPGAIAVWNDGGYGHVAVVVEVQNNSNIRVMESNFNGKQFIDDHRGWFNPTTSQGTVEYIYPR
ncbi:peptidoglycan hydrolase PcsB [Streptococcus halichoeri]|uniref:peptidoglycan hydrolase PcsB n=1 Tax=Streptococcus halichoeri TaxID=254785 RepID=UPI00135C22EA|nr:CHAP domain-containing protein [Streptococcus halichoeri]